MATVVPHDSPRGSLGNNTAAGTTQREFGLKPNSRYKTDAADVEQLLRLVQSVPSPKAEPFKVWLAQVGSQRLEQMHDPELSIQQALQDYRRLGYSEDWINQRLKSIEIRKELTDEWQRVGIMRWLPRSISERLM